MHDILYIWISFLLKQPMALTHSLVRLWVIISFYITTIFWFLKTLSCAENENNVSLRSNNSFFQVQLKGVWASWNTYVCGCAGSSPKVTLSPWISLKHFSQKWYLSANHKITVFVLQVLDKRKIPQNLNSRSCVSKWTDIQQVDGSTLLTYF